MRKSVTFLLCIILPYISTTLSIKRAERPYCDVRTESGIRFDFTALGANDRLIQDEKFGDSMKLSLCNPLKQICQGSNGFRVCVTRNGTEIGLGSAPPDRMDPDNGNFEFVFRGGICERNENYSVHVIMQCDNEDGHDNEPRAKASDCTYHVSWSSKAACSPEKTTNCTVVGSGGEHYDLSPLTMRSDNYEISVGDGSDTEIILNVCHSVVFKHCARCPPSAGACLKERGKVTEFKYST